ncbi:MAG: GNAT family N-acetyltransferase [Betaproteobacteria bacterium]|nr:GNAT family N-acetyltransferase [Betaproteobacteria bacterium]
MSDQILLEVVDTLADVPAGEWDRLASGHPLLSHAFLHALHESGSAAPDSGWTPRFLLLRRGGHLAGALPLYLKDHSYGEYVFDWAWADAWHRAGGTYYPKLLCAIPFTPVAGPRLLATEARDRSALLQGAIRLAQELEVSSFHCLFPTEAQALECEQAGLMLRRTVQFHWHNEGFRSFEDFLARMNHEKRKKIRQERRRVREAGVEFVWKVGDEITDEDWRFFARCYQDTYRRHHSTPYLNLDFFRRIGRSMSPNLLLALGLREGEPVCAALDVFSADALYGRYWGTTTYVPGLHFEACYYQAIEFCIARGIARFEGGAQGEHKLARGLMPVTTYSAHWVADPRFDRAVRDYVQRESRGVAAYVNELEEHAPFKDDGLEV